MEEWPKDIFEILESVTDMVDEFFQGVTDMVETVANDVQNTVEIGIDQCWQEMFDMFEPISEIFFADLEMMMFSETEEQTYYSYPVEPTVEKNPACVGCHHYHGQVYGGNLFVCAMHPYGWETENCPDRESYQ